MHTLCREKLGLGVKYKRFPGKHGLDRETNFSWDEDGFGPENQHFPRKNQIKTTTDHQQQQQQTVEKRYGQSPQRLFFSYP